MIQQQWVGSHVDSPQDSVSLVRAIGTSLVALVILAFVGATVGVPPGKRVSLATDEDLAVAEQRSVAPATAQVAPQAASGASTGPIKPAQAQEEASVARFLASKYQLALDHMQEIVEIAYRTGREVKVDPLLLLAVAGVESRFDPDAESGRGAKGLMQIHTRVHADKFAAFGGVSAAFDPLANMKVGAKILKEYLRRDGSVEGALKSYVGAADQTDDRGYGAKVLSERARLVAAAGKVAR